LTESVKYSNSKV